MQKYPPLPVWNFSPVWIPEANEHLPSPSHTSPKAAGMGGGSPSILVSCLLPPPTPPEVIAVEWLRGRKGKASWLPVFKTLYLLHESLGPPAILAIHSFISLFFLPSVLQPAFHRSVSPDDLSIAALTRAPTYLSPSNSHLACYCMAISRFIYSFS